MAGDQSKKMIKRLTARNYKCFKTLDLEFSPTVTTIIGPNDAGKSTILQLLKYISLNKPRGKKLRWGEKQLTATLFFDDHKVTRRAGKVNSYSLNGKKFNAFRSDVPEEIAKHFAIAEINFQQQRDDSFWLSLSPGQLAKQLNSLVDLEAIDQTQQAISKHIRTTTATIDVCQTRLSEARREKSSLKGIKNLDKRINTLARQAGVIIPRLNAHASELRTIINNASLLTGRVQIANEMTCVCDKIRRLGRDVLACNDTANDLRRLIADARRHRLLLDGPAAPDTTTIDALVNEIDQHDRELASLQRLISTATHQENDACRLQKQLDAAKRNLQTKLNGRCPVCLHSLGNTQLI